jgi:hypothetical protein
VGREQEKKQLEKTTRASSWSRLNEAPSDSEACDSQAWDLASCWDLESHASESADIRGCLVEPIFEGSDSSGPLLLPNPATAQLEGPPLNKAPNSSAHAPASAVGPPARTPLNARSESDEPPSSDRVHPALTAARGKPGKA